MTRQFVISGKIRKQKKKELAELKRFVSNFWLHNDMDAVYGGGMSKEEADQLLQQKSKEAEQLENELNQTV